MRVCMAYPTVAPMTYEKEAQTPKDGHYIISYRHKPG